MKLELKRVTENDLEHLMEWRARPDISKFLLSDIKPDMEKQRAWFKRLQQDKTQIRWIIWCDGVPIGLNGITDIDYQNQKCETGPMFIAEIKYRSLELLMNIRCNLRDYIFYKLGLNKFYSYVMTDNRQLVKLAKMTGCDVEGVLRQHVIKYGEFHDLAIISMRRAQWDELKKTEHYEQCFIE